MPEICRNCGLPENVCACEFIIRELGEIFSSSSEDRELIEKRVKVNTDLTDFACVVLEKLEALGLKFPSVNSHGEIDVDRAKLALNKVRFILIDDDDDDDDGRKLDFIKRD